MDYIKSWDKTKERLNAFWKCEIIDRCVISITAPRDCSALKNDVRPVTSEDMVRYWTDGELILKRNTNSFSNTYFAGDAIPMIFLYLGAAGHAGFFKGSRIRFEKLEEQDTVWFFPIINDYEKDELVFDQNSFLYNKTLELAKYLVSEGKGRFFVSMPDISGNLDALAHLRGTIPLLEDLYDDPEHVKKNLSIIQDVWCRVNNEVYEITKDNNEGGSCIGWMNTWAYGKHTQMQSDISVMLSPEMFEEFVMPELRAQTEWIDHPLYHFDGAEQIRHLDMLLSIEKLETIQWTCVAGQPSPLEYIPVLKKIQKAGKRLYIILKPNEVEHILTELSSKGLYLKVQAESQDEADAILKLVEKLSHE